MKSEIGHIQINVSDFEKSKKFYSELFEILGWTKYMEEGEVISWTDGHFSIWINKTESNFSGSKFHRKNTGINHIAFRVNSRDEVTEFSNKFLKDKPNSVLYNSPKEYPEYGDYYAVFFEDPDRIKIEVAYHP